MSDCRFHEGVVGRFIYLKKPTLKVLRKKVYVTFIKHNTLLETKPVTQRNKIQNKISPKHISSNTKNRSVVSFPINHITTLHIFLVTL